MCARAGEYQASAKSKISRVHEGVFVVDTHDLTTKFDSNQPNLSVKSLFP